MGTTPESLKKDIQSGNLSQLTKGMSDDEKAKLNQALSNKEMTEKILSSPEAQDIIKKLSNKK